MTIKPKYNLAEKTIVRQDLPVHIGKRNNLIQKILKSDNFNSIPLEDLEIVIDSFNRVPRHFFIEQILEEKAYEDRPLSIGVDQTISRPSTVIFQTYLLKPTDKDRILEIGTGSAFQTCILADLCNGVHSIERQKSLYQKRKELFENVYFNTLVSTEKFLLKEKFKNIQFYFGDGFSGLDLQLKFDKILITCAAPKIPENLFEKLKINGIMVLPLNEKSFHNITSSHPTSLPQSSTSNYNNDMQRMVRITKINEEEFHLESFKNFKFVPMLKGTRTNINHLFTV